MIYDVTTFLPLGQDTAIWFLLSELSNLNFWELHHELDTQHTQTSSLMDSQSFKMEANTFCPASKTGYMICVI